MSAPSPALLSSRADVVTATPDRYAKQLVSHLGRRLSFEADDTGRVFEASLASARIRVAVSGHALVLTVSAADAAGLALGEHVLGSHLERFAHRAPVTVSWVRSPATGD